MMENAHEARRETKVKVIPADKLLKMEIPPREDLIENIIGAHSLSFLAGEEGCGKSLLVMNLAMAVATRQDKWLSYAVHRHGKVLFLNNEISLHDFGRRLQTMSRAMADPADISDLLVVPDTPIIPNCWQSINEICLDEKPVLVVLDCFYLAHDGDENDASSMRRVMQYLLHLRNTYNLAVLVVHHIKKGSDGSKLRSNMMRGSSVFGAGTDNIIIMLRSDKDEHKRIFKATKGRHISDESRKTHELALDKDTLWFTDGGEVEGGNESRSTKAAEGINWDAVFREKQEMQFREILVACEPQGWSAKTIQRAIDTAVASGILKKIRHGIYALHRPGVDEITAGAS